jgi:hypothetical protein
MKYHLSWLKKIFDEGEMLDFLFFWGHQPSKDGKITATCLSQWWKSDFLVDDILYPTAEHWMMAQKARLFQDEEILEKILVSKEPDLAKKYGRSVKNFDGKLWDEHKYTFVKEGNIHKFSQNTGLQTFLLQTKNKILVEASPVDNIWGIGLAKDFPEIHNPYQWKGLNLLGFALMEVRDELINQKNK